MTNADDQANASKDSSTLQLGPFEVRVESTEAEAFRGATGGDKEIERVPFTFPIRWLARDEIRAAAAQLMEGDDWVPVHESQSFDYREPLTLNADYRMTVAMSRAIAPPRILLQAEVGRDGGEPCLRMEMILRIVAIPQEERAARQ